MEGKPWLIVRDANPYLLLCHARGASRGDPADNRNNHPFVSLDGKIALIHNGRVLEETYGRMTEAHPTESECDSEVILRALEGRSDMGEAIQDVWDLLYGSHMAVAVGERSEEGAGLWLFRNEHRTLCVADVRPVLGQIFFVSTSDIWTEASSGLLSAASEDLSPGMLHHFQFKADTMSERSFSLNT